MKRTLLALTGTGILALGLIAGSFALTAGIPGVQAMSFIEGIPMLHNGHNSMHGGSGHHDMDCPYMDDMQAGMMSRGNPHQMMNDETDGPFPAETPGNSMHRGMHDNIGHHGRHMMRADRDCPHMAEHANQ